MHNMYQDKDFCKLIQPILRNIEFQRRKTFLHHQDSVYEHSIEVAWYSYKIAKKIDKYKKINIKNVIVSALLHDFYTTPWRENKKSILWKQHGFVHGRIAAENAYQIFPKFMNERIEDSIKKHMFPLTIIPPKYIEGWIITTADKYVSFKVFKKPTELPRYIGIDLRKEIIVSKCKYLYHATQNFVSNMY